ncbi:hypothetical protein B4U80_14171, partial [Leptotrombidium deliense]
LECNIEAKVKDNILSDFIKGEETKSVITVKCDCDIINEPHYHCDKCDHFFTKKSHLKKHKKYIHLINLVPLCNVCGIEFETTLLRDLHVKENHNNEEARCNVCGEFFEDMHTDSKLVD